MKNSLTKKLKSRKTKSKKTKFRKLSNNVINQLIDQQIINFKNHKHKWDTNEEIRINHLFKHYIRNNNLFINQNNKRPLVKSQKQKITFYDKFNEISQTHLFNLLSKMPKGAILHCHLEATVLISEFIEYLHIKNPKILNNIYYLKSDKKSLEIHKEYLDSLKNINFDDLYIGSYISPNPYTLGYFDHGEPHSGWKSLKYVKPNSIEMKNLVTANQMNQYNPANGFDILERLFDQFWTIIKHQNLFPYYLDKIVEKMIETKVSHCDFRLYLGSLHSKKLVYENNHFKYYQAYGFGNYNLEFNLLNNILNKHPSVFSASLILCKFRFQLTENKSQFYSIISDIIHNNNNNNNNNNTSKNIIKSVQKVIIGFDGFSQEFHNKNNRNKRFNQLIIDDITKIKNEFGINMLYYPHAGETEESEGLYNKNLTHILDTLPYLKRIGHGLALIKYPLLDNIYLEKQIHIELNPLSNHLLGFIDDIRNHPGLIYLRKGHRISINPDDPAIFGYDSVNYDWYMISIMWEITLNDIYKMCRYSLEDSGLINRGTVEYNNKFTYWEDEFNTWLNSVKNELNNYCILQKTNNLCI